MKLNNECDGIYFNLGVKYDTTDKKICVEIELDNGDESVIQEYIPTKKEEKAIMSVIENTFKQNYGCSLAEFCKEFYSQEWKMEGMK